MTKRQNGVLLSARTRLDRAAKLLRSMTLKDYKAAETDFNRFVREAMYAVSFVQDVKREIFEGIPLD